jgi:hypothetical protein
MINALFHQQLLIFTTWKGEHEINDVASLKIAATKKFEGQHFYNSSSALKHPLDEGPT